MKSRSHQPLILKKRKPSRPGSPAEEDDEARSPAGRVQQEQQGISARDPQDIPASPSQAALGGDGFALVSMRGVSRSPAPPDAQSLLDLLAAEQSPGKDPGLGSLSGPGSSSLGPEIKPFQDRSPSEEGTVTPASQGEEKLAGMSPWSQEELDFLASQSLGSPEEERTSGEEAANSGLNSSLTNIHWLGKMTSTPLSSCSMKKDTEKENQTPKQRTIKSEGSPAAAPVPSPLRKEPFSERPPYSYMAMIQFAINSTEKQRMMLKDIYAWIEDHFPYFKHVAKPGWKNSVRHNLSLHDMFVRETSANGKIAFWTIHPEANRYLTLDQVFKQQKRPTLDLQKTLKVNKVESQTSRPKIKPLLPRVSSYLVPVHFPASEPFHLQLPSRLSLPAGQTASGTTQINTGERPAPKILRSSEDPVLSPPPRSVKEECYHGEESSSLTLQRPLEEGSCTDSRKPSAGVLRDSFHAQEWVSSFGPAWPVKEEPVGAGEEQNLCVHASLVKQKRQVTGPRSSPQSKLVIKRQELGRSRRKQHLALASSEEPVLLLPLSGGSASFPMGHCPSTQEEPLGTLVCGPEEEPPLTCRLPMASTPNKTPVTTSTPLPPPDQWRLAPLVNERSKVDFSSPRSSPLPFLSFQDNLDLEFNEAPLRQSLGDSPQCPLLDAETGEIVSGLLNTSSPSSKVACQFAGDNSLLEDLALDNMPENWNRLSLDISFPDPENDNLETDLSWSQLLPQLK